MRTGRSFHTIILEALRPCRGHKNFSNPPTFSFLFLRFFSMPLSKFSPTLPGMFSTPPFYLTPQVLSLTPPTQYGYTTSAPHSDSTSSYWRWIPRSWSKTGLGIWHRNRTLLYAVRGSIPVRTFLGLKNRPCPISMRTEPPKKGKQSDKKCGHGGRSVGRSDPYADVCGNLLARSFTNKTKAEETVIDHRLSQEPSLLFILTHRPSFFNSVNARTPSISASKLSSEIWGERLLEPPR